MQAGRRYTLRQTLNWTRKYILLFIIYDSIPILIFYFFGWQWMKIPWQPLSLIGIAVAFYLGFKNNSAYERLWEARKIWGGIVNASRSFTVMARDFISRNGEGKHSQSNSYLADIKTIVHRHVAWLYALTIELRKVMPWEHNSKSDKIFRKRMDSEFDEKKFEDLRKFLSEEDLEYIMKKGNKSSHLLSLQSKALKSIRQRELIDQFELMELQKMITEFYALQGKSERIKNFPFPRQYAAVNYFFVVLFVVLLPFGMLDVFSDLGHEFWIWFSIPFSVVGSWVFWMIEMIGDYSENPFEGLYNDVPITSMARGIEIDIRQMLEETDLPEPIKPAGSHKVLT